MFDGPTGHRNPWLTDSALPFAKRIRERPTSRKLYSELIMRRS